MGEGHQRFRSAVLASVLGAASLVFSAAIAAAQNLSYNEFKIGVLSHDSHALGGKEHGIDINPEILLESPITDAMAATVPEWLRWAVQPRPTAGGEINTDGYTNQAYFGATWTWQLFGNVIQPGDGIVLSYFFGPGFNDGDIQSNRPDHKALGSHVLFREAIDLGYRITPTVMVSGFIDHVSNGGLAKENQSINDLGVRLGIRF